MSALVQYEPFVDNTTKLFLEQTRNIYVDNPEGCDFTQWLQFYAFDVIGEITYSKRHGFVENNKDVDGIVAYLSWLFLYVAPVSFSFPLSVIHRSKLTPLGRPNSIPRPPPAQKPHLSQALTMGFHRRYIPRGTLC